MSTWEWYRRLAPLAPYGELARGFAAEIADPLWLLGRQWQLGEHQGEDASSPVIAQVDVSHHRLDPLDAARDPAIVPGEVLVESGRDDWWTLGRRIRLGRSAAARLGGAALGNETRFGLLPAPYEDFAGEVDGREVTAAI